MKKKAAHTKGFLSFGSSAIFPPEDPKLSAPFLKGIGFIGVLCSCFIYIIRHYLCQIQILNADYLPLFSVTFGNAR
jgi:hypothetical protein